MWNKFNTGFSSIIVVLAFSIAVLFSSNTVNAQSLWKINSGPNGGSSGSTGAPQDGNSSKTGLFILGGAVVAGFILYKVVFEENDETDDSSKTNESASILIPSHSKLVVKNLGSLKNQDDPPVNLYLGIRGDNYNTAVEEKTYVVGLSFKF